MNKQRFTQWGSWSGRLTLAVLGLCSLIPASAFACDAALPRCRALNQLVSNLQYERKLLEMQQVCLSMTEGLDPDADVKVNPLRYPGLRPGDPMWPKVRAAYDEFREEACGPQELMLVVLERYRVAWDDLLPAGKLDDMVRYTSQPLPAPESKLSKSARKQLFELETLKGRARKSVEPYFRSLVGAMGRRALDGYVGQVQALAKANREQLPPDSPSATAAR